MKIIYLIGIIALLSAMMVMPAAAKTIYVNVTGWWIDGGEFNASSSPVEYVVRDSPYLEDGDTVFVYNGTYEVTLLHNDNLAIQKSITLKGEGADVVTLDGMGKPVIYIGAWEASPGCVVEGFRIVNGSVGVAVANAESPNCIIRNNVFDGMSTAISAAYSPNTTIKGNVIDGLSKYIEFRASPVTFVDNVVSNSTKTYASVKFYIPDAVIVNNTFINNVAGMGLYTGTINATVARNNFISSGAGIKLYNAPSGNRIYLNNIVDNTDNVVISGSGTPINIWNSTEPIEYTHDGAIHTNYLGNYWSDYSGVDTSLEDGIGDTPYDIPPASPVDYDHHPLMESFENYISEEAPSAPTPPTSFLISGNITYDNGNPILNPTVTVRNIDTSEDFTVKTDAGSNYYRVLTDSSHVSAGNAILINASDGTVYNGATHIVTASEIETGGFMQDMILESGDKPDLIVTEMSGECVSLSTYNITYTVKNNGSMAADASTTSTRIDGTEVATEPVPALAIGESHTSTVGPFTLSGDNDTIEVCADSADVIYESNETNNCLSNLYEPPSIPDLIVWGIAKTPGDISEENILGVRVKNIGTANAGSFDVSLSIDGTQVLLETVTSLAAGETTELEYTWTPAGAGEYAFSATVDTNNDVEEFDETNNDYTRTSVIIKRTDWPQFHYDASGIGFSPSGAPSTDAVKWVSEDISAGGGLSWDSSSDMGPLVAGGKVFTYCGAEGFSSTPYDVACLDEETGELLWKITLPYPMIYGSWAPLGYDDGMVFCTVNHYVVTLDADDGSIVWECDLDSPEFEGHAWSVNSG
ncbi:MAG: right-handed parallel beta-helix repeat-containing protein, partial [Methanophagales archaeon]|nr:right-handed parallel beta-helix repeat-containing protein [Methanophagales archaeon]